MCLADKKLTELMTEQLMTVTPHTLLTVIDDIFTNENFHHIPVVEEDSGRCVGIISKSDYYQLQDKFTKFNRVSAEKTNDRFFQTLMAEEVMTQELVELGCQSTVQEAIAIFLTNKVSSIIIQDENGLKGIITPIDMLKEINVIPCLNPLEAVNA